MGINSTEVSYNFGQMGSILITGTSNATSSNLLAGMDNAVFVAITFLTDTEFDGSGLVAEDPLMYPSSGYVSASIDANGGSTTDTHIFPKGLTIYGRWTEILLDSGKVIAYVGY